MARRKTTLPQSQATYRPGRASVSNTEPHGLRQRTPVRYDAGSETEDTVPNTQSSESSDQDKWWEIRRITAERKRKGKKREYKVEWEGTDDNHQPWPQEWKPWNEVTTEAVREWNEYKSRKRRREPSPSQDDPPVAVVSETVQISRQDLERYRKGRKRLRLDDDLAKTLPSLQEMSSQEDEGLPVDTEQDRIGGGEEEQQYAKLSKSSTEPGLGERLPHDFESPKVIGRKQSRRLVIESSQSIGGDSSVLGGDKDRIHESDEQNSQTLSGSSSTRQSLFAVEIPLRNDIGSSPYATAPSAPLLLQSDRGQSAQDDQDLANQSNEEEEAGTFGEITIFGISDEEESPSNEAVEVQVPQTQSSIGAVKEIPDSQSSVASSIRLTPSDPQPVPETPLNTRTAVISASPGQLIPAQESVPLQPIRPAFGNDFEDIPDSSNRVFSQDVREMKSQEANSQNSDSKGSQKSNGSQQSSASLPLAQLSFGKVGVTPSFQSLPDGESGPIDVDVGEGSHGIMADTAEDLPLSVGNVGGQAQKSVVAAEAAPHVSHLEEPRSPQSQTPSIHPAPQPTHITQLTQESTHATDDASYLTARSFPKTDSDPAPRLITVAEPLIIPKLVTNTVRLLQEAVESRPASIDNLDSKANQSIQPAQLETLESHDQGAGESDGPNNLSIRNSPSCQPETTQSSIDFLRPVSDLPFPGSPIREDPLQGARSASSTPGGPIPASAQPAPVTVLGYFPPSRNPRGTSSQGSKDINAPAETKKLLESSAALRQAVGEMSAAPAAPVLPISSIPSGPELLTGLEIQAVRDPSFGQPAAPSSPGSIASLENIQQRIEVENEGLGLDKTSVTEGPPSIDDEYLAASQAVGLLRESPRLAPDEFFLALPLSDNQRMMYQTTITDRYRDVEAFFGINNTQNEGGTITVEMMKNMVNDLESIADHWEILDNRSYASHDEGQKLFKWFRKQSSKLDFLARLLKKLRSETYSVALVVHPGLFMDYFEHFLNSGGYRFTHFGPISAQSEPSPQGRTFNPMTTEGQTLYIGLIPSTTPDDQFTLPTVDLVIAVDSSVDPSFPHIQKLRAGPASSSPQKQLLHLVGANTVAHIRRFLPESSEASGRDLVQDYLNPILFATVIMRDYIGIIPETLQKTLDALSTTNVFLWLENLRHVSGLLPALPLDPQSSQAGDTTDQRAVSSMSPKRKRMLSQTIATNSLSSTNKKARFDLEQSSPHHGGDNPILGQVDAPESPEAMAEDSLAKQPEEVSSAAVVSDISDTITHVTSTMPIREPRLEDASVPALEVASSEDHNINVSIAAKPTEDQLEEGEENVDEDAILETLSKEEVVSLLKEYQEALWASKVHADEWERHISAREIDYQEQREKIIGLKETIRFQKSQLDAITEERDLFKAAADRNTQERNKAREDLRRFKEALKDTQRENEMAAIVLQNAELTGQVEVLDRKRKSAESEANFLREQYQAGTRGTQMLMAHRSHLEEQVEELARKADDVKVQLKEKNMDVERGKYKERIAELTAKLDRSNKQITILEIERKRVERTRGVQTRSSSIPPKASQSSPAPTRSASPSQATHHRQLRGAPDGP